MEEPWELIDHLPAIFTRPAPHPPVVRGRYSEDLVRGVWTSPAGQYTRSPGVGQERLSAAGETRVAGLS